MRFPLGSKRPPVDPPMPARPAPPPRIGLALGGGSARGWAHIGVIQELASHGVHPEIVAGTSIGAVVGACYAAGKLEALETFALALNRRRMLGLMDLSLSGTGLIAGSRLQRRLERELGGLTLESLPKSFAAVATELGSGREVCLTRGDVVAALRASYALPGIFEPQLLGGRWLFDGAMSNPVPVSICRALGADVVLAVNLTADLGRAEQPETDVTTDASVADLDDLAASAIEPARPRRRLRRLFQRRAAGLSRLERGPGIASVMVGAFSIAQERISRSRLAIDPPDAMIHARLTSVGLFDFHRAAELIAHGRHVTRLAWPDVAAKLKAGRRLPG